MSNRKPVKYFVFYSGGMKRSPIFLIHDPKGNENKDVLKVGDRFLSIEDIVFHVLVKTSHVIFRVSRSEIMKLIAFEKRKSYGYFEREKFKDDLETLSDFVNENSSNFCLD